MKCSVLMYLSVTGVKYLRSYLDLFLLYNTVSLHGEQMGSLS